MTPAEPNSSLLAQIGIKVDESYTIAETDRLSYFYVLIPPSRSTRTNKTPVKADLPRIASIGIHFGDASAVNVVPLSLDSLPNSGLRRAGALRDGSSVYELQVQMPGSMCTGSDRGACNLVNWRAYSIANDNGTSRSSEASASVYVACGSQCDSPSESPCSNGTCQPCDGQQVAGGDQPYTRRFNMGTTSGDVDFVYETYTIKDQITVVYDGKTIVDSDCVGTYGEVSTKVSFSGNSKELRVDVRPDCAGETDTRWYFTLSCPEIFTTHYTQHFTTQYNNNHTIEYNTTQYNTIEYNTTQYNTIEYNTTQYNTIQHNTTLYNTEHNTAGVGKESRKVRERTWLAADEPGKR